MKRWRLVLLVAAVVPVAGLLLAALAPTGWWVAALAMHWAPHLAVLSLPFWCWQGRRWQVGLAMLVLSGAALWPSILAAFAVEAPAPQDGITVTTANLYFRSPRHAEAIARLDGGLVALIETRPEDYALVAGDPRWPYQRWQRPAKVGGLALLSAYPMRCKDRELEQAYGLDARIELPWGPLRVLVLHSWSPMGPTRCAGNRRQLAELAGLAETEPGPLLVLGDLNASPGDPGLRLLRGAGLRPPHGGAVRTWPSHLGPFGIAIDHILARGLALGAAEAIDLPGSDHHAVRARLSPGTARDPRASGNEGLPAHHPHRAPTPPPTR